MIYEGRITQSCIYWADDVRETLEVPINADTLEEAKTKLNKEALRLEFRSASKLVQDVLIKIGEEWVSIL